MRSRRSAWAWRRHRREQGAVAVMVALLTCFVLIPLGALTIDIGMQRVARRDMQSVADTVALDMARTLGGGTTPTDPLASASAATSSPGVGSAPVVHVYTGYIAPGATLVSDQSLGCGSSSRYNAYFQSATAAGQNPNAVLVTASSTVKFGLAGGSGGVCRSALAGTVGAACYDVGSYAAAVDTGRSALINPYLRQVAQQTGVFSNSATVTAIDYAGLAQSQVDLAGLAAGLGIGSVNQLATSTVRLNTYYVALLNAMSVPRNATNVAALNGLISTTSSSSAMVNLGSILGVSSGTSSVAGATMDLLDLVGGSITALNGTNVASVNVGTGTLLGVANANAQVTLIQGPHHFCGTVGSTARTATDPALTRQLGVTMTAQLNPGSQTITVPGIAGLMGGTTASVPLPNNTTTTVSVAPTSTTLTSITCSGAKGINLDVTNGLATFSFETDVSNLSVNTTLLNLTLLGLPVASLNAKLTIPSTHLKVTGTLSPSGVVHFSVTVPNQQFDTFYPTSSTGLGFTVAPPSAVSLQAQATTSILGVINAGASVSLTSAQQSQIFDALIGSVVKGLFDNTNPSSFASTVLNPLIGLLGADFGGSEIALDSTPAPTCSQPIMLG